MASPVALNKYQILVAPDSKKIQGLRVGDIVRRQYFDGANTIYSLMCVTANGTTVKTATEAVYDANGNPQFDASTGEILTQEVSKNVPYFIGALLEGNAPQTSELLDFARITNLFDTDRSGALYLTASDEAAPFMDVIDGIGRNKSLCWPENLASESFEDSRSQYIIDGSGLTATYTAKSLENSRIIRLTRDAAAFSFSGLKQDFYELVAAQKRILVSYKARASQAVTVNAEIAYTGGTVKDADWSETFDTDWQYCFQAINVINSGRHLRSFKLNLQSLGVGEWVEIADFNIILQDSISNFGEATSMRIGKLDGVVDPVYGTLSGYGAYIQKLYASQTAHISGTLTAGDENGFASTFYAGKIHRNCFKNSCDINFQGGVAIDNATLINPTGMGNVYKSEGNDALAMVCQTYDWLEKNVDSRYCFSFWGYAKKPCQFNVLQNGYAVGTIQVTADQTHEWRRLNLFFDVLLPETESDMVVTIQPAFQESEYQSIAGSLNPDEEVWFFTAPQLEAGENCTQYQPTDDILDETNDYGAWFARGGIGGTIQNPLLRLNYDGTGAIDTRTNSFRLNQDGSGFLAKENIKWDVNGNVTFGDNVTLTWDNLTPEAKEELTNRYVRILGPDTFTMIGQEDSTNGVTCSPSSIILELDEVGFQSTSSQRQWYLLVGEQWEAIPNANGQTFNVLPESYLWSGYVTQPPLQDEDGNDIVYHGESRISLKCEITLDEDHIYTDVCTLTKQFVQGYTVKVTSSKGNSFQNGTCATILTATVYYQGQLVDTQYALDNFTFTWHRYNINDLDTELSFDDLDVTDGANVITLNYEMDGTDVYVCELGLADCFDYSFPVIF